LETIQAKIAKNYTNALLLHVTTFGRIEQFGRLFSGKRSRNFQYW